MGNLHALINRCRGKDICSPNANVVNRRLLSPVHEWLGAVLRTIPMDGTYEQHKPLTFLKGSADYKYILTLQYTTKSGRKKKLLEKETKPEKVYY